MTKDEIKIKLRDWMTADSQLIAVEFVNVYRQELSPTGIASWWRHRYPGLEMTEAWVKKALRLKKR